MLLLQCIEFNPKYAVFLDNNKIDYLVQQLRMHKCSTIVLSTAADLVYLMTLSDVHIVMSAIVGSAGLLPTYHAILNGKKVLLANKESLIAAGKLITKALIDNPTSQLIPVDSEHSAILQSLPHGFLNNRHNTSSSVKKIILTASGGPFYKFSHQQLSMVTAKMAIKHPNWNMGRKISVDSSTLMNKGLEVIEAHWLFGFARHQIDILIHPQSIIHSMVEYIDGAFIAQLGAPDMRMPIAYALAYPDRIPSNSSVLDFSKLTSLTFDTPDYANFPCLELALTTLETGKASSAVLNAANEIAVEAFLNNQITFYQINQLIESSCKYFSDSDYHSIDDIIEIDQATRKYTKSLLTKTFAPVAT